MKWIRCQDELPKTDLRFGIPQKEYLCAIQHRGGSGYTYMVLNYCDGWDCSVMTNGNIYRKSEIKDVVAWCEVPKFEEEK